MQFIAKDEQMFRKVREAKALYVDKTRHVHTLFRAGTYFFIARPRRFGKSLLCSMLAELFAGNRDLFKGLWIDSEESDWAWEKHPVLHLDMTKVVGRTVDDVTQRLLNELTEFANRYKIVFNNATTPAEMLKQLIEGIHATTGKQVVLIIDEYDKPLLDVIGHDQLREEIHDVLKFFYSPLKPLSPHLKFVFITGVYKFAKTSIFSTLNNLNDISFDMPAGELLGYTEDEIKIFFAEHLAALAAKRNETPETCMDVLRTNFNGYHFGLDVEIDTFSQGIYNPFALNYVFSKQQIIDEWFASGVPTSLVQTIAYEELRSLNPYNLITDLTILKTSCAPNAMSTLSMLYYAGYVTMKKIERIVMGGKLQFDLTLSFPNLTTASAFTDLLLPLALDKDQLQITHITRKTYRALVDTSLNQLQALLNDYLAPISYHVLSKDKQYQPHENLYQVAFYGLFFATGLTPITEDTTNRGRMDLSVHVANTTYIFELKMDQPAADAIRQIKDKDYAAKYRNQGKKIYAIGVNLSSKERRVDELGWELL
jgi:hypothetical protein